MKPFELPIQEKEQKVLGKDIVILNMSFGGNLDALVRKSFDLDELGLKDQIRTTGLGFAKNLNDLKMSGHLRKSLLIVKCHCNLSL